MDIPQRFIDRMKAVLPKSKKQEGIKIAVETAQD